MRLAVGKDTDLLQIQLIVVAALVFTSRPGLCADHDLALSQLCLVHIHYLFEIANERVILVKVALHFDQHLLQDLPLLLTCPSRDGHPGQSQTSLKTWVMHIQLSKAWLLSLGSLKGPGQIAHPALVNNAWRESPSKGSCFALDTGQADSIVDAPGMLAEQSTLRGIITPQLVDLLWRLR